MLAFVCHGRIQYWDFANILHNCFTSDYLLLWGSVTQQSGVQPVIRIPRTLKYYHSRIRLVLMFSSVLRILNWSRRQYLKYCGTNILYIVRCSYRSWILWRPSVSLRSHSNSHCIETSQWRIFWSVQWEGSIAGKFQPYLTQQSASRLKTIILTATLRHCPGTP